MKRLIVTISLAIIAGISFAQDAQFSQFYAAPLYLNPAFAGTDSGARLGFNFRNQWPKILGQFITYDLEFDHHINALHSGFGVIAMKDEAGSGTMSTTTFGGMYSFQQHIYKELNISVGLEGAYMQENLDWSKYFPGDNQNPRFPCFDTVIQEIAPRGTTSFLDLSWGMLAYTKEFYAGISLTHITEPNFSMISANCPLPMKTTANFGAMIPIDSGKVTTYLSPNLIIVQQENFQQVNL